MEKVQFQELIQNFTSLTGEEANNLIQLQQQYPYSQVIQSLAARASHDHDLQDHDHYLHLSAIYSTDRNILKAIMNMPGSSRKAKSQAVTVSASDAPLDAPVVVDSNLTGDALYDEVMNDLKLLKKLKRNFETVADEVHITPVKAETTEKKSTRKKIATDATDGLIEEIKSTKKKLKTEDPKQIEQIEIIDQFIKTQPSIGKIKPNPNQETRDLAENSAMFGENIISETLVEILLKQGKKDKALEVLKKLIWKFPQKKAYFAARIEELKK